MDSLRYFKNRVDAGKQLALALKKYKNKDVVVYGLPRGGVVVAHEVAQYLQAPLDLIITRKIGHPYSPEYAIGAVAANGHQSIDIAEFIDQAWLKNEIIRERKEARRRRKLYLKNKKPISAKNKIAILVDDGVATGMTIRVGVLELKHQKPKKIIVAVPVIAREVVNKFKSKVDELVALVIPEVYLGSVSAYYEDFPQVTDNEVISVINQY